MRKICAIVSWVRRGYCGKWLRALVSVSLMCRERVRGTAGSAKRARARSATTCRCAWRACANNYSSRLPGRPNRRLLSYASGSGPSME